MKYVTYVILFGLLGIIYLIYRGISKYLDYAAKVFTYSITGLGYSVYTNYKYTI